MKIGILTFHRANNYGAVLQCYALQEVVRKLGHDVRVIDYRQPTIERLYANLDFRMIVANALKCNFSFFSNIVSFANYRRKRNRYFDEFRKRFLLIDKKECDTLKSIPRNFDTYLIGSDQLWSGSTKNIDEVYMGFFKPYIAGKIVAYAISVNWNFMLKLPEQKIKDAIANFDAFSIREDVDNTILEMFFQDDVNICIDPTLLVDRKTWLDISSDLNNDKYVLVYEVRKKKSNEDMLLLEAQKIANRNNWKVVYVDNNVNCSVIDFLNYFRNAEIVLTSSFHGTAFSLIFHKNFYSYKLDEPSDKRYVSLLKRLQLDDRIMQIAERVSSKGDINYKNVEQNLKHIRSESLDFLQKVL